MRKLLILVFVFVFTTNVYAGEVYYKDKEIFDDSVLIDGTTYVPIRAVAKYLNLSLDYNSQNKNIYLEDELEHSELIAHGGGELDDILCSNSKEAITSSILKGYELIELDMAFTSDEKLVGIHDFEVGMSKYFKEAYRDVDYDEFMDFTMVNDMTQISTDDIVELMDVYPDFYIVTDTKYDNIEMLGYIAENYPDYINRFVPQIYDYDEYDEVSDLGYENIILTLYKRSFDKDTLIDFASDNDLFAITMPYERALDGFATDIYDESGVPVYANTVNDVDTLDSLKDLGVYGVYTDSLNFIDIK